MEPRRLRVLVVDDEDLSRWATHQLLARHGHEVEEAASAEAALDKIQGWTPDAILMDVGLPGASGIAFLKIVRQRRPDIPTILMTAHPTVESAVAAVREGATDYLAKPLDPVELKAALERAIIRRPPAQMKPS